ncbi:MAG TPA: MFS transporter [bacterium]|nr:MFS transporter [bacterium]
MRAFADSTRRQLRFWLGRIHPEAGKFLAFALIQFLLGVGFGCGFLAANALLITRAGTEPLFYVYTGSSLLSLALAGIFYFLSDRFPRNRLFIVSLLAEGFFLVLLWALIQARPDLLWTYYLLRIYLYGVFVLSTLQFWLLASDHFNHFEAQRWFPYLVAAGILGDFFGGLLASALAAPWGSTNLVLLWAWALLLSPLLVLSLGQPKVRSQATPESKTARATPAGPAAYSHPRGLSIALLVFWVAYSFFAYGVDYLYNRRALAALQSADELSAFFGKVTLAASAAVLCYQLFFAARLTRRLGMDRVVFIIPALLLAGSTALYFYPGLGSAAFAEAMVFFFVEFAAVSLLQPVFNLYPPSARGRVKMLVEGAGRPVGILLLLAWGLALPLLSSGLALETVLFATALAFLAFPWFFRRLYRRYLRDLLHAPEPHLVSNAIQALGEPNKKEMAPELCRLLKEAQSLDLKKTIVLSLGRIRSRDAFEDIVGLFSVKDEGLQIAVLESLSGYRNYESVLTLFRLLKSEQNVSLQVRMSATRLLTKLVGKKMIPFLLESLNDPDPRMRANALESIGMLKDRKATGILLPYLEDMNNRVRANAAVALASFSRTRNRARDTIMELFRSQDLKARLSGIYALGEMGDRSQAEIFARLLHSPDRRLRMHAAVALAKLKAPDFLGCFLELLQDSDETSAAEAARHILRFPAGSRRLLFEGIAGLKMAQRRLILARLEASALDFSLEKSLLWDQEMEETEEVPGAPLPNKIMV